MLGFKKPTRGTKTGVLGRTLEALSAVLLAASALSCNMQSTHLAYVTAGGDGIFAFRVRNGNGVITQVFSSPFLPQDSVFGIVVHPSNRFALVANQRDGSVSLLSIDASSGALTEKLPRTPAGISPGPMILNSDGSFLYVADQGLNQILVFSVSGSGSLSQVASARVGSTPSGLTLASSGFLFVPVPNFSAIYVFTVNSGTLTPVCSGTGPVCSPFVVNHGVAPSLGVDPAGKFLYVPNPATSTVSGFVIASGGALMPVPGIDFSTGTSTATTGTSTSTVPVAATVDPSGKFLYVANSNTTTATAFNIDPNTGDLTAFTTTPFGVGSNPEFIVFDPDNKFMYVADSGSHSITQLFFNSNGSLTSTGNTMTIGSVPRGLAFTK
jgi:6-phosphogluconolactonase